MGKEPKILTKCSMSDIWNKEAIDFTPWLSKHLSELSEVLDLSLNPKGTEVSIGKKRCDILATEGIDGNKVIIENKFEKIDHRHIGQGITYLTNIGAKTVIWVCEKFSEEHLVAIQKLNEMTDETFSFYAVRINTYKVQGDFYYDYAVEAKPNYLTKSNGLSATALRYYNAWQELAEKVGSKFDVKVYGRSYNEFRLPISGMKLGTSLSKNTQDVYFWTYDDDLYKKFSKFINDKKYSNVFIEKAGVKNPNCQTWVVTRPESSKESFDMQWTADQLKKAYEIAQEYYHQNN